MDDCKTCGKLHHEVEVSSDGEETKCDGLNIPIYIRGSEYYTDVNRTRKIIHCLYHEKRKQSANGWEEIMNSVTIRQLHQDGKLSWAKMCFYLTLEQFTHDELKEIGLHEIGNLDKQIQFTFDGKPIPIDVMFERFHNNLNKYIENKAEEMFNSYLDVMQSRMDKHMENLKEDFSTIRESMMQGTPPKFEDD